MVGSASIRLYKPASPTSCMSNLAELFQKAGLTEYESRAIAALLAQGQLEAHEVSAVASIPNGKVYDALMDLHEKGLVSVVGSNPKVYRARPTKTIVRILQELRTTELDLQLDGLKEVLNGAAMKMKPTSGSGTPAPVAELFSFRGPYRSERAVRKDEARREFLSFSGDASWVAADLPLLEGMVRRGVDVRIIAPPTEVAKRNLEPARGIGAKARFGGVPFHGEIIDGRAVYVVHLERNRYNPTRHRYRTLAIYQPGLVKAVRDNFTSLWNSAKRA